MTTAPPGVLRAVVILAKFALRRRINRIRGNLSGAWRKRKTAAAPEKRTATPPKSRGSFLGMLFLGGIFLLNGFTFASLFLGRLEDELEKLDGSRKGLPVSEYLYGELELAAKALHTAEAWPEGSKERAKGRQEWQAFLEKAFEHEVTIAQVPKEERAARIAQWRVTFERQGPGGFRRKHIHVPFLSEPADEECPALGRAMGLTYLLLGPALMAMMIGQYQQHLGTASWSMEWLYTLPVHARVIFLAQIVESAAGNFLNWFITFPLSVAMLRAAGFGWWSLPLALGLAVYVGAVAGCVHTIAETWFRKSFSAGKLKNIQALIVVFGTLLFFGVMWLALGEVGPSYLAAWSCHLPALALWNPLSLPALLCAGTTAPWLACAAVLVAGAASVLLSVHACELMVAQGLIRAAGAYEGVRKTAAGAARTPSRSQPGLIRGIAAKELRLLLRDRAFMVQALIMPLLILGYQVALNPALLKGAAGNIQHGATLAFGLGAYVFLFSAFQVLSSEGPGLWLLYTFPRDLRTILCQKTLLWCGFALLYTLATLGICALYNPALDWDALSYATTAVVGVVLCAFIAAALGILATDPLEAEAQRRVDPMMMQLYLMLAAMYALVIYNPSVWAKLVQITLSLLLAFALWQKVRDRIPYMLDPTEAPPARLGLSDGLIAALAFFVLQGLMMILLVVGKAGLPLGASLLLAFVTAGVLVTVLTLYIYWRNKVPELWATLGFCAPRAGPRASFVGAIFYGILAGGAASLAACAYLWVLRHNETLRRLRDEALKLSGPFSSSENTWWLGMLAIFAAPLFEEYIFRGLVYRGMRRSFSPAGAILASAAIFAIVHPPISALPVFGLGVAAALAFEKSRLLVAPVVAHMVYNAVVVGQSLLGH